MSNILQEIFTLFLKVFSFPKRIFAVASAQLAVSAEVFNDVREILPPLKVKKRVQ